MLFALTYQKNSSCIVLLLLLACMQYALHFHFRTHRRTDMYKKTFSTYSCFFLLSIFILFYPRLAGSEREKQQSRLSSKPDKYSLTQWRKVDDDDKNETTVNR